MATFAQLKNIKDANLATLFAIDGVVGVGLGPRTGPLTPANYKAFTQTTGEDAKGVNRKHLVLQNKATSSSSFMDVDTMSEPGAPMGSATACSSSWPGWHRPGPLSPPAKPSNPLLRAAQHQCLARLRPPSV